ncbi:MAG: hypothetical protein JWO78_2076 [Micavibrio sp.]|nr:hypothetical protein [Micavibrio sp.]
MSLYKNVFNISSQSTQKEVAEQVANYAMNRKLREDDHAVVRLLEQSDYRSFQNAHPDDLQIAGSQQDRAAFALIGVAMDHFKAGSTVPQQDIRNLKAYANAPKIQAWG